MFLCSNIYVLLDLNKGYNFKVNGNYRVFLINVIGNEYKTVSINISINFIDNKIIEIIDENCDDNILNKFNTFFEKKFLKY